MTLNDLIAEFRTTYDLGSLGLPGFEDDEIRSILDIQVYRAISQKFGGNNVYGKKFPDSEKRIDDLQNLMKIASASVGTTNRGYRLVLLPTDYLHLVEVMVEHGTGEVEEAIQVDYSRIARFQNSKRNQQAYIKNPIFVFDKSGASRALRLYIDSSYTADPAVRVMYIQKPTQALTSVVGTTTLVDFNDDVYHEIVAMAVDHAINIASPNKSQISQQQLNKIE